MSDQSNQSGDSARPQRPRSPRLPVNLPVTIEGITAAGAEFREAAEITRLSRGGATIRSAVAIEAGAAIRVTARSGETIDAEVNGVWTDEADGSQYIGVKLLSEHGWFAE